MMSAPLLSAPPSETGLSHVDDRSNQPKMVDVSDKRVSHRTAHARALLAVPPEVSRLLEGKKELVSAKGPVLATAIIAGTMAVKQTSNLIPFCHPLPINGCDITINLVDYKESKALQVDCQVKVQGKTGVEMEALTGATVSCLAIYDMVKAITHDMQIVDAKLIRKTGGKRDVDLTPPAQ